ncbi:MAG TPA: 1,4-dihydroxy-2-naphthoate polyprenyltransferase [Cytophagaceae bacterium]|jgi:1,4-dihydroxy-2-naphthoate octaprenyltransferase|nr:1,4-dihydroxy-2-naphthoate polyprenyltransferase [Cytophagaceae bacterium]
MAKSIPYNAWLKAFRLRTLPLALASISMGGFLAAGYKNFKIEIFLLCILTTVLLQILSNLANDYGDYMNGADLTGRIGPERSVQSGAISPAVMKNAIVLFAFLSFASGLYLLYISSTFQSFNTFGFFLVLGILAIVASIKYTAGKNPYGYSGLGDISVLIFFGWVAVCGSFFLQTRTIYLEILLPATSCGLFATGVLNINNIRDIESDAEAGKKTIPMRLGKEKAVWYHMALLLTGFLCTLVFTILTYKSLWQLLFLISVPLLILNIVKVKTLDSKNLDPYLKQMAITTLIFVFSFGIGFLLSISCIS